MPSKVLNSCMQQLANLEKVKYLGISNLEYENWSKQATIDGLKGIRLGQSFCAHFGITDYILHYSKCHIYCDEYIKKTYVRS
jgi:hypothetical protein